MIIYRPMVDSLHEIFVGHGAKEVGSPTDLEEAGHIEWVPLADVPGLMARGELMGSGILVALLHILVSRSKPGHNRTLSKSTRRRCRTKPVWRANSRACRRRVCARRRTRPVRGALAQGRCGDRPALGQRWGLPR